MYTATENELAAGMNLVKALARQARYLPDGIDYDDLVSAGHEGLCTALERFTPDGPAKFTTYAYQLVKCAIRNEIDKWSPAGRNYQQLGRKARSLADSEMTDAEVAEAMGIGMIRYERMRVALALKPVSLDRLVADDPEAPTFGETLGGTYDTLLTVIREEMRDEVSAALKLINQGDVKVLYYVYYEELSFADTGRVMGISGVWAWQRHRRALDELRGILGVAIEEEFAYVSAA